MSKQSSLIYLPININQVLSEPGLQYILLLSTRLSYNNTQHIRHQCMCVLYVCTLDIHSGQVFTFPKDLKTFFYGLEGL